MKQIGKAQGISKITGTICCIQGAVAFFVAVMTGKLLATTSVDELGISVAEQIPLVIFFCALYGVVSFVYAYLRFCFATQRKWVTLCWKYKITVILYILLSGMSFAWVIPTLTASTDLRWFIQIPIGVIGMTAILLDAYLYIRVFIQWLRGES